MPSSPPPTFAAWRRLVAGGDETVALPSITPGTVVPAPPEARQESGGGRIRRWLRESLGVVMLVPGLMLLAGGSLLLLSASSLSEENQQNWRDRVSEDSANVADAAERTFAQAGPLLAAVGQAAQERNALAALANGELVPVLRELLCARPGVAAVSVFDAAGNGWRCAVDPVSSEVRAVACSATGDEVVAALDAPSPPADGSDAVPMTVARLLPEQRALFARSLGARGAQWTAPYHLAVASQDGSEGIACARALPAAAADQPGGVAMVEFTSRSLRATIEAEVAHGVHHTKAFIFTAEGHMLVAPSKRVLQPTPSREGALSFADALADLPGPGELRLFDHSHRGLPELAAVRRLELPAGPALYVAAVAPIRSLAESTSRLMTQSRWIGGSAVVVAVALAWLLAFRLDRQRRQVLDARASAAAAADRLERMGSYTLVRRLSSGGMGEIWEAEHQLLARPAALKLISMEQVASSEPERQAARVRFAREAQVTASLRSPHTVTVYDFGFTRDGAFFYAMELLDGMDLETLVAHCGHQPPARVIAIMVQVCRSLAEAHACGMVHRDIKPANIHLCRLGLEVDVVKVLDFGLVAERAMVESRGTVQGTPAFMAPEQARGEPIDGRSDLYALGAVAYWLLTGQTLFDEEHPTRLLIKQVSDSPRPLALIAPQAIPDELDELVTALLAKEPERRPQDALAVIAALESIELPADEAWTPARARAWWATHHRLNTATSDRSPSPADVTATDVGGRGRLVAEVLGVLGRGGR